MKMEMPEIAWQRCRWALHLGLLFALGSDPARAQGPSPESAPTIFPGGGLVSYSSEFMARHTLAAASPQSATARPGHSHIGRMEFAWGFHRDLELIVVLPVVTVRFASAAAIPPIHAGGTGLGDMRLLLKYRFYRRDSDRGTTQASFALGPRLPIGRTNLHDASGLQLPAGLQPGSGAAGLSLEGNWTYTGLFHIRKLVADESFLFEWTGEGTGRLQLGNSLESRLWLSYRPYQTRDGRRELFVGPSLTWLHAGDDRLASAGQPGSGGDAFLLGVTSYAGLRPGLHVFISADFPTAQTANRFQMQANYRVRFGITKQFRLHR